MLINVLNNQTIYQCEHCNKRFLSKTGVKKHETIYCFKSPIVKENRRKEILNCEHEWDTAWSPIFGEEHLSEPSHDYCIKCGVDNLESNEIDK